MELPHVHNMDGTNNIRKKKTHWIQQLSIEKIQKILKSKLKQHRKPITWRKYWKRNKNWMELFLTSAVRTLQKPDGFKSIPVCVVSMENWYILKNCHSSSSSSLCVFFVSTYDSSIRTHLFSYALFCLCGFYFSSFSKSIHVSFSRFDNL